MRLERARARIAAGGADGVAEWPRTRGWSRQHGDGDGGHRALRVALQQCRARSVFGGVHSNKTVDQRVMTPRPMSGLPSWVGGLLQLTIDTQ